MAIFKELCGLIPDGGSIRLNVSCKDGNVTVMALPKFAHENGTVLPPLSMSGAAEEVDDEFVRALSDYRPAVQEFHSSLEYAKQKADEEAKAIKEKADAIKKKAAAKKGNKGNDEEAKAKLEERKGAPYSENDRSKLISVPASDQNFKSALATASKETLLSALEHPRMVLAGKVKLVATELAKLSDESAKELLETYLPAKYRQTSNGTQAALGKLLEETTGKTLEALGLVAKQGNILAFAEGM